MTSFSNSNARIAKNTLFLYVRMVFVLFVSLYTTRIVLKSLGVVDYGINNVVGGFVSMLTFLSTSMSNGVQRFYNFTLGADSDESLTKVYNMSLIIQLIITLIVILFLETFGLWYMKNKMVIPTNRLDVALWVYHFSVISLVLVILEIPYSAAIMAYEKMDYFAYVSIIEVVLKLLFSMMLSQLSCDKLLIYGSYSVGVRFLNFVLFFVYCKVHFKSIRLQHHFYGELFKNMLLFSNWNILGTLAYVLKNQGVNVLLNAYFGPVVNAARGVSGMIGHAIQGFQSNIVISFRPQMVQSYAEMNYPRVTSLMFSLSKISYLMLFTLSMPVIVELPFVLKLWLGDVVPDFTIPFTVLILINMIISSLNKPLSLVVHATGNMMKYQIGTSIVVCMTLPISYIILKQGGKPTTVYIVSLCMTITNQVICLLLLKRIFKYSIMEYIKQVILPCIIVSFLSTIFPIILHCVWYTSFLRFTVVTIVGLASTIVVSYFFALNNYEKDLVIGLTKKIVGIK